MRSTRPRAITSRASRVESISAFKLVCFSGKRIASVALPLLNAETAETAERRIIFLRGLRGLCVKKAAGRLLFSFEERLQPSRTRWMPELSQRLCLDLTDTLASDGEMLSDLFERMLRAGVAKPETHLDHLLFARRQRREQDRK